jgi:hypothetical protein
LFAAGEQGAWYDPSDLTTMFQDNIGTTPVTGTGQAVGLLLDKSKGLALGPELVTNGDFSNGTTGWIAAFVGTSPAGSVSAGVAQLPRTAGSNYGYFAQVVVGPSGLYKVSVTIGANPVVFRAGTGPTSSLYSNTNLTTGTQTLYFFASAADPVVTFYGLSNGTTATVDNISVKLLPGNHAVQATTAARPFYGVHPFGGRRNLLTWTEDFRNTATAGQTRPWTSSLVVVAADSTTAPDGTTTADTIAATSANDFHYLAVVASVSNGFSYTLSFYAKNGGYGFVRYFDGSANNAVYTLSGTGAITDNSGGAATITPVGDGWYRCTKTVVTSATTQNIYIYPQNVVGSVPYAGNGTAGVFLWGTQFELGSTASAYQRVTDQYNVTEAGVASVGYLFFDGANDSMSTSSVDFTATDKMSVFAGVRKLSDGSERIIAELGVDAASAAFVINSPLSSSNSAARFLSRGTTAGQAFSGSLTAPISFVATGIGDISGDRATLRINGTQADQSTADQGTGTYGNYPLFIGARNNASLFFSGHLYSLIVRGASSSSILTSATEGWVASKTGVVIA